MSKTQRMVWIDMEMTGLNPEKHVILEIATIVTDENLKILEEGPVIAIKRTDAEMDRIEEWSNKTHSSSGLLERSNSSLTNVQEAEKKTLAFLEKWINQVKHHYAATLNTKTGDLWSKKCKIWKNSFTIELLMLAH